MKQSASQKANTKSNTAKLDWAIEGSALLQVEHEGSWADSAQSFTAFVKARASTIGIDQSALWRAIASVRFHKALGTTFEGWPVPKLDIWAQTVSAEIMELLERHSRVAARRDLLALLQQAIAGQLSRRALQESWKIYQGLQTSNRRGRRPIGATHSNESKSPISPDSKFEVQVLSTLSKPYFFWLGTSAPYASKTFIRPSVQIARAESQSRYLSFDFLAVIQETIFSDSCLHGVIITPRHLTSHGLSSISSSSEYVDFLWIASTSPSVAAEVDKRYGLLSFDHNNLIISRPPVRCVSNADRVSQLLMRLMLKAKEP